MKKTAKPTSPKTGRSKLKTKKVSVNEGADQTGVADAKEKVAFDAHGSATPENAVPLESTEVLDENDESKSTCEILAGNAEGDPALVAGAPSEEVTAEIIASAGLKPSWKKGVMKAVLVQHEKLSDLERTTLKECLEVIREGMDTFVHVGNAIAMIIVQKLYRETHHTFQRYANEVLGISPRRAYQLKDASEVIDNLKQANTRSNEDGGTAQLQMPTNENQVRALKEFPPDVQCEIWRDAVKAAGEKKVTGKVLAQVIEARAKSAYETAEDPAQMESSKDEGSRFEEEIEKVIATLNHAWKILPEAHHRALLDRVSNWLASAREAD